jgi:NTE family protein/lysophospholipid hydrolase
MGAVIASFYALGWDEKKIMASLKEAFITNNVFNDYTLPVISLLRCRNLDCAMQKVYGETQIEDLWLNYFCVSSNLTMANLEIHRCGSLWQAIRASISFPGIAVPVVKDGHLLIDGGVLNNLPVDIMRSLCKGTSIAVDVSQVEDLKVWQSEFPSPWKMFYKKFFKTKPGQQFPSILDILMRTAELASIHQRTKTIAEADMYLNPPVHEYKLLDFEHLDALIDIGYQYTKKEIARWEKEGLLEKCMAYVIL